MATGELKTDLAWWWSPARGFGVLLSLAGLACGISFIVTEGDSWQGLLGAAAAALSPQVWLLSDFSEWKRWRQSSRGDR